MEPRRGLLGAIKRRQRPKDIRNRKLGLRRVVWAREQGWCTAGMILDE